MLLYKTKWSNQAGKNSSGNWQPGWIITGKVQVRYHGKRPYQEPEGIHFIADVYRDEEGNEYLATRSAAVIRRFIRSGDYTLWHEYDPHHRYFTTDYKPYIRAKQNIGYL